MQNFGLNRSIRHLDVRKTQRLTGLAETLIHKPVESGARIRLAKRRDHGMTRDIFDGIASASASVSRASVSYCTRS